MISWPDLMQRGLILCNKDEGEPMTSYLLYFFFSFSFSHTLKMKFLEVNSLELINTAFRWETSECVLTGRVEAYSCK